MDQPKCYGIVWMDGKQYRLEWQLLCRHAFNQGWVPNWFVAKYGIEAS